VDARVLAARAVVPCSDGMHCIDASAPGLRRVVGPSAEHLLVDRGRDLVRIDVLEGTTADTHASLHIDLPLGCWVQPRIAAVRALVAPPQVTPHHTQLAHRLLCLQALDARAAGASLKDVAEILFGGGDWPGDGEHRKSRVRRMIVAGERMVDGGPGMILAW
jgi:Uncharacterized conserved protein (DUF2285)